MLSNLIYFLQIIHVIKSYTFLSNQYIQINLHRIVAKVNVITSYTIPSNHSCYRIVQSPFKSIHSNQSAY